MGSGLASRGHMLWRSWLIYSRLAGHGPYTCSSRTRMVRDMLVKREESGWGEFLTADCTQHMWLRQKASELLCLTPVPSMGECTLAPALRQRQWQYQTRGYSYVWRHVSWQAGSNSLAPLSSSTPFPPGRAIWLWHTGDVLWNIVAYISVCVLFVQYWRHS